MVLFIDTDPGSDDIMAIIYILMHTKHEVVGMSSVSGNLDIETTTRNLRLIVGYFNKEYQQQIPVYKGVSKPIVHVTESNASSYHGFDGCGNFFSSTYYKTHQNEIEGLINGVILEQIPAVMGLIEMSKKHSGELIILALGPLSNIALAQIIDPEFGSRVKEIWIMGGDLYGYGNSDIHFGAEFNFNHDPEAAYVVLKEMSCMKTIVPLEPNFTVGIQKEIAGRWIEKLKTKDDVLASLMLSIVDFHVSTFPTVEFYDLMLAMTFVDPLTAAEMQSMSVVIELEGRYTRGKMVFDHYNKGSNHTFRPFTEVNVVKSFNRDRIFQKLEILFA